MSASSTPISSRSARVPRPRRARRNRRRPERRRYRSSLTGSSPSSTSNSSPRRTTASARIRIAPLTGRVEAPPPTGSRQTWPEPPIQHRQSVSALGEDVCVGTGRSSGGVVLVLERHEPGRGSRSQPAPTLSWPSSLVKLRSRPRSRHGSMASGRSEDRVQIRSLPKGLASTPSDGTCSSVPAAGGVDRPALGSPRRHGGTGRTALSGTSPPAASLKRRSPIPSRSEADDGGSSASPAGRTDPSSPAGPCMASAP